MITTLIGIALWALIPGFIAKKKGRKFYNYYFLSFLVSPLVTLIISLTVKDLNPSNSQQSNFFSLNDSTAKKHTQTTIESERNKRWDEQAQIDRHALEDGSLYAQQVLQSIETIQALWESTSCFDNRDNPQQTYRNSILYLSALTPELFLTNYNLFADGNQEDIKDAIYQERPYLILDILIQMGLYIFETNNNLQILTYIIDNTNSSKLKEQAQNILDLC